MANEEHKSLAQFLKSVHLSLRQSTLKIGAEQAWIEHCKNQHVLETYARYMEKLATTHWEENCANDSKEATSRIEWAANFIYKFFINKTYQDYRKKEVEIASKINVELDIEECFSHPIKLIDVGSCYNPFKQYSFLDVCAIDLCPANNHVLQCDFLSVTVKESILIEQQKLIELPHDYFDVVTFCFFLEYIPTPELRIKACENAYKILKSGGLLIINTPDSKHVGANSKLMKNWRFTLSKLGFIRIKYEKERHMHCMAFRKALNKATAVRWATIHDDGSMEYAINIPQDFNSEFDEDETSTHDVTIEVSADDFNEMPFCND